MLKITTDDVAAFKEEFDLNVDELDLELMKSILEQLTGDQLSFNDIMAFGNGKIISEQI